ncbi:biotin-dependent carboxyltransferase family protein [Flavihumibacter petaseus]|uniref:KipI antagonist n=1 Tax=Flavihumibacter petaseus NBRC 106054 TaxID=1220578 RepID=A0A0E9MWW5_9BACT|nr:biotin-dependent carboxyltransferase family protein [Flavihumibacter petaseus]GAO42242.1 KipI antagonist [Flavihumibacter petaseus NBRC 106054]
MKILNAGISGIQDPGRPGFRSFGITPGGAMDQQALRLTNLLAANEPSAATIEIAAGNWAAIALSDHLIAVGGHNHQVEIAGKPVAKWHPHLLQAGETISIAAPSGGYAYIAIHGGIRCQPVLGSRSTFAAGGFGGIQGRLLKNGDLLPLAVLSTLTAEKIIRRIKGPAHRPFGLAGSQLPAYDNTTIRIMKGLAFDHLTEAAQAQLGDNLFEITAMTNRMGARLKGVPLATRIPQRSFSTAVQAGTIQLSPDGQLLVLLADAQVTGGYPIIAQVAEADMSILVQKPRGSSIRFQLITHTIATGLLLDASRQIQQLQKDLDLHLT